MTDIQIRPRYDISDEAEARRPGITAFTQHVVAALRSMGKSDKEILYQLSTCVTKVLFTNARIEVKSHGMVQTIDNPHLGGANVELLPQTLKGCL